MHANVPKPSLKNNIPRTTLIGVLLGAFFMTAIFLWAVATMTQNVQIFSALSNDAWTKQTMQQSIMDTQTVSNQFLKNSLREQALLTSTLRSSRNMKPLSVKPFIKAFYEEGTQKLWLYYSSLSDPALSVIQPQLTSVDHFPETPIMSPSGILNTRFASDITRWIHQNKIMETDSEQTLVVLPPSYDPNTGRIAFTLTNPIFDDNQQMIGCLASSIELDQLISLINTIRTPSSILYISDSSDNVVALSKGNTQEMGFHTNSRPSPMVDREEYTFVNQSFRSSSDLNVQKIHAPLDDSPTLSKMTINNRTYLHWQVRLNPFHVWTSEKGLRTERWFIGILLPQESAITPGTLALADFTKSMSDIPWLVVATILFIVSGIAFLLFRFRMNSQKQFLHLAEMIRRIGESKEPADSTLNIEDIPDIFVQPLRELEAAISNRFSALNNRLEVQRQEINIREFREQQLVSLKMYDSLTDLPTQELLMEQLIEWMNSPNGIEHSGTIILLGLDHFRRINEDFSHKGGNSVLNQVAHRLINLRNQYSFVCRVGGDEFALVYHLEDDIDDIDLKINEIFTIFEKPFLEDNTELFLSACMGICSYPLDGTDPNELLKNAVTALNAAKETGTGSHQFYDVFMDETSRQKRTISNALRRALDNEELRLVYQPIVQLQTNQLVGFEALIRWNNPDLGLVMPTTFIPIAEENGLIVPMSNWILFEACRQLKEWNTRLNRSLTVSVNVSALHFRQPNFVDTVKEMTLLTELPPQFLNLELTEGLLIEDVERVKEMLNQLRDYGIEISIDDFGTGYSSLNYIRDFPVNKLKIDRSFIKDFPDSDPGTIAQIIVQFSEALGMRAVAEGIETIEQLNFLTERGCHEGQGYYFNAPLTPLEVEKMLDSDTYGIRKA